MNDVIKQFQCRYVQTGKNPKISNTLFYTVLAQILLFMKLFPKIPSEMADNVDPDQTAPAGGSVGCVSNW